MLTTAILAPLSFTDPVLLLQDVINGETKSQNQESPEEPTPKRQKLGTEATIDTSVDACKDRLSEQCDLSNGDGGTKDDTGCVACYGLLEIEHLKASFQQVCCVRKYCTLLKSILPLNLLHLCS